MSIYVSLRSPDAEEHEDDCARWDKHGDTWDVHEDIACDCGQPAAPLRYQGSHVLPALTDERGGWVDLAYIPSHITRDGRDDKPDGESPWPFLRFGVNGETVVLTPRHVRAIVAELGHWLAAVSSSDGPQAVASDSGSGS